MKKKCLAFLLALVLLCALAVPAGAYDGGDISEKSVVSAGDYHTAVVDGYGTLWMWGHNDRGQLGSGTNEDSSVPLRIMSGVASVSCGRFHTAILKQDGTLWMCGENYWGQLGNNSTDISAVPVQVLDHVAAVSCGAYHTAAILEDGSLWMWGSNKGGQLANEGKGNAQTSGGTYIQVSPIKVMDNVTAVSCGDSHTAAVKKDGTLWTWGNNDWGQLGDGTQSWSDTPIKVMDNVQAVSCWRGDRSGSGQKRVRLDTWVPSYETYSYTCEAIDASGTAALRADGTLWTWGCSEDGGLGNGGDHNATCGRRYYYGFNDIYFDLHDFYVQTVPVKILDGVVSVSCGGSHSAAVKEDGSLWVWGNNDYGQLGSKATGNFVQPVKIMAGVSVAVCGTAHTVALKEDGTLWTWGDNRDGRLGRATTGDKDSAAAQVHLYQSDDAANDPAPSQPTPSQPTPPQLTPSFTDLKPNAFYLEPVAWAVSLGITTGTTNTTFSPDQNCTHGQILTFLWRAAGSPASDAVTPIAMKGNEYYYGAVKWAAGKGMIGNSFNPSAPCNRADAVNYIWQAAGKGAARYDGRFTDVPASAAYARAVAWAVANGVTTGTSATTFTPNKICNRGEIVTFLHRYFGK